MHAPIHYDVDHSWLYNVILYIDMCKGIIHVTCEQSLLLHNMCNNVLAIYYYIKGHDNIYIAAKRCHCCNDQYGV